MRFRLSLITAGLAAVCVAALVGHAAGPRTEVSALLVLAGVSATGATFALLRPALHAGHLLTVIFLLYGGVSALLASADLEAANAPFATAIDHLTALGLAERGGTAVDPATARAFDHAGALTIGALALALLGLAIVGRFASVASPPRRLTGEELRRVRRAGKLLVCLGALGVLLALGRVAISPHEGSPWQVAKSFWQGGAWILAVGHLALPGFAFLLAAELADGTRRRALLALCVGLVVYSLVLIPAGQRTFAIEAALLISVLLGASGRLSPRRLALVLSVGVVLLGVSQAVRNDVRELGNVDIGRVVQRLQPSQLRSLYGSQFASFAYTVDVERYRGAVAIDNSLPALLQKPIPRQLLPNKSQGFSSQFTQQLYPEAAAQDVNFATPLTAELDWDLGPWLALVAFAALGVMLAIAELKVRHAPVALRGTLWFALGWATFVLVRGDLANSLLAAAGWALPALFVVAYARWPGRGRQRVVVDALQVAPQFSGVGRMVLAIGQSLSREPPPVPVVLRCAENVVDLFAPAFPKDIEIEMPLRSSMPRFVRLAYQQLWRPLSESRSTTLLCPGDQAPVWGRARVVLVLFDVRRLVSAEDGTSPAERLTYRLLVPPSVRRASTIITASRFSAAEIERAVHPPVPVRVVAHRPPLPALTPLPPPGELLCVGALRPYKGLDLIVEALALLDAPQRPVVHFVGMGPMLDELRARADERGVGAAVRWHGWVPDADVEALYERCACVVCPSTYEGYGLPVLEGLARGRVVVASDIPPHREVAADAALFFEAGSARELAEALRTCAGSRDVRDRYRELGLARVAELRTREPTWAQLIFEDGAPDVGAAADPRRTERIARD